MAWTSPTVRRLRSIDQNENPLGVPLTTFQIAMITGLFPFGAALSPPLLLDICNKIGRKNTILILSTMMTLANMILSFASHVYVYYAVRFMLGICAGTADAVVSVFLSEIAEDHNRGRIGCFMGMSYPTGSLIVYVLGSLCSVRTYTLLCTLPNIINIICFLTFIPESPSYLASNKRKKETLAALDRLRNKNPGEVEKEYEALVQTLKSTTEEGESSWKDILSVKSLRKGFVISVVLTILQQFAGIGAILAYAGPLFDAAGSVLTGDVVGILIGLLYIFGDIIAIMIIERVGRRPLLLFSTLGGVIPHFLLGLFFYLKNSGSQTIENFLFLPIVSILTFIITYSVGLSVIPPVIPGVLMPNNAKTKVTSVIFFISYFCFSTVTVVFPIMNDYVGPSWCMWFFAVVESLTFVFVYFFLPEVTGKSSQEIQELLSK